MVNARRTNNTTNRDLSIQEGRIRRREIIRQRLRQTRNPIARRLFIDIDEVPDDAIDSFNEEILREFDLPPASLNPEAVLDREPTEGSIEDTDFDDHSSDASTIIIELNQDNQLIAEELFRAWEREAGINPSSSIGVQAPHTPPGSPPPSPVLSPLWPGYRPPSYSPLTVEDVEEFERANLQREIEPLFSDPEDADMIADEYAAAIISFLDRSIAENEE